MPVSKRQLDGRASRWWEKTEKAETIRMGLVQP